MDHEEGSDLDRDLVAGIPTDDAIEVEVKDALYWNGVDTSKVNVSVCSGAVVLSGEVPSAEQKEKAGLIAEGIRGVTDVSNDLAVAMAPRR